MENLKILTVEKLETADIFTNAARLVMLFSQYVF